MKTNKTWRIFKLVVQCSTYNWLYQVMLHKATSVKSCFWTLTVSGLLPTSSESFTVIHGKESVAGVLLLAQLCFRIYGILSFSKEDFIKCCYSSICIVNNSRLKHKRRKEFLLPADSEQKEYIIPMLIAEKNDALYGTIYCYNKEQVADKTSCSLECHWQ